jgi:carboxypeptidase family protein
MRRLVRAVRIVATFVCLALPGPAAAQPPTGSITGLVTTDQGRPLSAVAVTVQNHLTGARRTATTDLDGRYEIPDLPAEGDYEARVTVAGFESAATENVRVVPRAILVVNFRLKLSVSESVGVAAETPRLETGQSTMQQTIGERLVHALPLAGRNFIPLAMLTAGFTGNENYPSPQGQIFWSNNVIVDGASHFSKWRSAARTFYSGYGLESIKEVQVLANRFSAEYGEALATVTSAVTKSGTDDLRGTALLFVQNSALNAAPEFALVKPPAGTEQYGFTLGGPIRRDRTHFLWSYEGRRARGHNIVVSSDPEVTGARTRDDQDEHLAFARVDHRRGGRTLSARYNGQFFRWHDEPGGLVLPGSGIHYRNDVHTLLATDRLRLSETLLSEFRAQFARYVDVRTDLDPSVLVTRAGYSQEGGVLGPLGMGADPEDTLEAADTLSAWRGAHAIRFGGGAKHVRAHNPFMNYGRGAYFFAGAPDQSASPYLFIQGFAPAAASAVADPRSTSAFAFVQDDWRPARGVVLNLGLRYDAETIRNVRNFDVPADRNNVQPRGGVAWEPFAGRGLVLRGGAGVYTQQHLLYYINRVALEGPGGTVTIALSPDSPLFPRFPGVLSALPGAAASPPRDLHVADAAFRNPYSVQATAGVEWQLPALTVSADYVRLTGHALMSLVDVNAPASNPKPNQRTVAQADATRPIPPVAGSFRNIVTLGNEGRSWYHGIQLKANRSLGRVQAVASYTWSRAEDAANYVLPEDSRNIAAEKAPADADVRHNVAIGFAWQTPGSRPLTRDWTLAGIGSFRSARPYTILWGDDRNGTTQNDARPGGRNTARADAYQDVDLALSRRVAVRRTTLDLRVESFNLFNATNHDQFVGTLLSPLFGRPVSAFPSRRTQLAATLRF